VNTHRDYAVSLSSIKVLATPLQQYVARCSPGGGNGHSMFFHAVLYATGKTEKVDVRRSGR